MAGGELLIDEAIRRTHTALSAATLADVDLMATLRDDARAEVEARGIRVAVCGELAGVSSADLEVLAGRALAAKDAAAVRGLVAEVLRHPPPEGAA